MRSFSISKPENITPFKNYQPSKLITNMPKNKIGLRFKYPSKLLSSVSNISLNKVLVPNEMASIMMPVDVTSQRSTEKSDEQTEVSQEVTDYLEFLKINAEMITRARRAMKKQILIEWGLMVPHLVNLIKDSVIKVRFTSKNICPERLTWLEIKTNYLINYHKSVLKRVREINGYFEDEEFFTI